MKLRLNGIDVDCIIGDLPDERERLQRRRVDVELTIPPDAADSDELSDTVDYAALTDRIRIALMAAKCRMIERAAKVVCSVCMGESRVSAVRAAVIKSGAIPHLESAEAIYEQSR